MGPDKRLLAKMAVLSAAALAAVVVLHLWLHKLSAPAVDPDLKATDLKHDCSVAWRGSRRHGIKIRPKHP